MQPPDTDFPSDNFPAKSRPSPRLFKHPSALTNRVCEKESTFKTTQIAKHNQRNQPTRNKQQQLARNERREATDGGLKLIPAGNFSFSIRIFRGQRFPVAHAGSQRDPVTKAKESAGVGQLVGRCFEVGGGAAGDAEDCGSELGKACAEAFSIDISV